MAIVTTWRPFRTTTLESIMSLFLKDVGEEIGEVIVAAVRAQQELEGLDVAPPFLAQFGHPGPEGAQVRYGPVEQSPHRGVIGVELDQVLLHERGGGATRGDFREFGQQLRLAERGEVRQAGIDDLRDVVDPVDRLGLRLDCLDREGDVELQADRETSR